MIKKLKLIYLKENNVMIKCTYTFERRTTIKLISMSIISHSPYFRVWWGKTALLSSKSQ